MLYKEALSLSKYYKPELQQAIKEVSRKSRGAVPGALLKPGRHRNVLDTVKIPVLKYRNVDPGYGDVLADMLRSQGLDPARYSVRGIVHGGQRIEPRPGTFLRRSFAGRARRTGSAWAGVTDKGDTLASKARLYAAAADGVGVSYRMYPLGGQSRYFANAATEPTMDIIMTSKYMDKLPNGRVLPGNGFDLSQGMMDKQRRLAGESQHLVPHRTIRHAFLKSPTAGGPLTKSVLKMEGAQTVGELPDYMLPEVVRSGVGKTDDVAAVVLRPHNTTGVLVTQNGVTSNQQLPDVGARSMPQIPLTHAVRGDWRHEANAAERAVRYRLRNAMAKYRGSPETYMRSARQELSVNGFAGVPDKVIRYLLENIGR